jgi:hypothetical protein
VHESFAVREWALNESSAPRAIVTSNAVIDTAPFDDVDGGVEGADPLTVVPTA